MGDGAVKAFGWDNNEGNMNAEKTMAAEWLSRSLIQLGVHPLFYAETRMANDIIPKGSSSNDKRQFNGLIDMLRKTLKTDGIAGVYRGFSIGFVASILDHGLLAAYLDYLSHGIGNIPVRFLFL